MGVGVGVGFCSLIWTQGDVYNSKVEYIENLGVIDKVGNSVL